jgi:translocation and assembly module TamB
MVDATTRDVSVGQEMADLVLAGITTLSLSADAENGGVRLNNFRLDNRQISAEGTGSVEGDYRQIELSARLRDVALFAPGFSGPLTLAGNVSETAVGYVVDLNGDGPGATTAQIKGSLASDFSRTDMRIQGDAQSAFLNRFIAPRNISGPIQFDLALVGAPQLASLSGRVWAENAQLVAPTFGINIDNMRVAADLSGGNAHLSAEATVRGGGQIVLSGPVALTKPYQSDLTVDLRSVRLRDPEVYDTSVNGKVAIRGPATGGALITGSVALGSTEIRIASTGLGGTSDLGKITHIHEPTPVRQTRVRAGMTDQGETRQSRGVPYQMDLAISAPGRIFVRGRGLDAELGGSLQIGGTTDDILPAGQFNLVRGRLDILGKRLTIDEGMVQLQGALLPYVRFAASTQTDGFTTTVVVEGNVAEPEIKFLSSPELPEEEVIAHLLFGRDLTSLSAFQALQLASAVATLAGRGGEGIVSKLRNSFGLDDLDVTSAQDGTTAVKVGKYLSEKVYTDVTVGSDGKSEINLNLDIRPGLAARGTLQSDGSTGLGIYYEKDY